jgi:hypothetical protein
MPDRISMQLCFGNKVLKSDFLFTRSGIDTEIIVTAQIDFVVG